MNAIMNGAPPLRNFNFAIPADEQQYLVLLQVEDSCNHRSDGFNPPIATGSIHGWNLAVSEFSSCSPQGTGLEIHSPEDEAIMFESKGELAEEELCSLSPQITGDGSKTGSLNCVFSPSGHQESEDKSEEAEDYLLIAEANQYDECEGPRLGRHAAAFPVQDIQCQDRSLEELRAQMLNHINRERILRAERNQTLTFFRARDVSSSRT